MATCVRKSFYGGKKFPFKTKKNEKVKICQNAPRPLSRKQYLKTIDTVTIKYFSNYAKLHFRPLEDFMSVEFSLSRRNCGSGLVIHEDLLPI